MENHKVKYREQLTERVSVRQRVERERQGRERERERGKRERNI